MGAPPGAYDLYVMRAESADRPDPHQGHAREWPSTRYSDEARTPEPALEDACCIALVGDCTVACRYFPPANRPEAHLAVRLRRAFPRQPFVLRNVASDGESAGGFVSSGRMEQVFAFLPHLEIAFVRYGINDRKQHGIAGYIANLETLCRALRGRYPEVQVVVETGMWVDYPAHYLWDRNASLGPLYDAMRTFANDAGYPVLDIYQKMRQETEWGNWDLRVRGLPVPEQTIVDDSFDAFFEEDPAFFTNIHPNSRCLGLIAAWQVALLQQLWPGGRLPGLSPP
jgi:GDSL-like Lipase/Acylhydrolase family